MTVSYERARDLAAARIGVGLVHPNGMRPMIIDAKTVVTDWGWVFFYDDERRILNDARRYAMVGNLPVVVTQ